MPRAASSIATTARKTAKPPKGGATAKRLDAKVPKVTGGVVSVRRSFQLLELLTEGDGLWSLAGVARRLDVNKAIALRLLEELCDCGFVYRDNATGGYLLTYKLSNLGLRKLAQTRLLDQSSGVLRELANDTGELVRLGVVEQNTRVTWVQAFVGARRTLHIDPNYRMDVQLNTHASGKAWLSTLSTERAWELLMAGGIAHCTEFSRTSRGEIEQDLSEARERGYATTYEENELGVGAIAAPIVVRLANGERTCVGVVSVAAPTSRMRREDMHKLAPPLLKGVLRLADMWPIQALASTVAPAD